MAGIKINTATKVTPQCYAYTTPGVPRHDGWTKIGFTERDVETRINEQTHTVGVEHKTWWHLRAAYMTEPYDTFTDKDFHAYLKKLGIAREKGTEWFQIEPNAAYGDFIAFTQNHGIVSDSDIAMLSFPISYVMSRTKLLRRHLLISNLMIGGNSSGMQNPVSGRHFLRMTFACA